MAKMTKQDRMAMVQKYAAIAMLLTLVVFNSLFTSNFFSAGTINNIITMYSNVTNWYTTNYIKTNNVDKCSFCGNKLPKRLNKNLKELSNEYPNACKTCLEKIYSLGMFYKFQEKTLVKSINKEVKKRAKLTKYWIKKLKHVVKSFRLIEQ